MNITSTSKTLELKLEMLNFKIIVEDASEIPFYRDLAYKIMRRLWIGQRATLRDILILEGGSSRRTLRLLHEMVKKNLINYRDGYFFLFPKEQAEASVCVCPRCGGRGIILNQKIWTSLLETLRPIWRNRPYPTFLFDQRPVTLESSILRVAYLYWRGDLDPRKSAIAILGDDDLSSLALVFFARIIGLSNIKVVVFEVDRRLTSFLSEVAQQHGFDNLKIVETDIFEKFLPPREFRDSFQVVLMDPTPSFEATRVFLSYGIALIQPQPGRTIYLSTNAPAYQDFLALQSFISRQNLLITEILPGFVHYALLPDVLSEMDRDLYAMYHQSMEIAFTESLIRLETTSSTQQFVTSQISFDAVLGKATKRILNNLDSDPAYRRELKNRSYFKIVAQKIQSKR